MAIQEEREMVEEIEIAEMEIGITVIRKEIRKILKRSRRDRISMIDSKAVGLMK